MRRYAALVVGVLAAALFLRLGVWQLDRLAQRRARNAQLEARLTSPPIRLADPGVPALPTDSLSYRSAQARGTFDFARQLVVMARARRGAPGVHVVTPLMLAESLAVLVERGWVPSADARGVDLRALAEPESAEVSGVLVVMPREVAAPSPASWPRYVRSPDPLALQAAYPYRLLPVVLRRDELPRALPPAFSPVPLPERGDGPHLSYALQWFAFAVIAVVGSIAVYRRTAREGGRGKEGK